MNLRKYLTINNIVILCMIIYAVEVPILQLFRFVLGVALFLFIAMLFESFYRLLFGRKTTFGVMVMADSTVFLMTATACLIVRVIFHAAGLTT